jgi:hypothetical protein
MAGAAIDQDRVRYSGGQGLHDARRVEDHGDRDSQDDKLREPSDLACEEEEERCDDGSAWILSDSS